MGVRRVAGLVVLFLVVFGTSYFLSYTGAGYVWSSMLLSDIFDTRSFWEMAPEERLGSLVYWYDHPWVERGYVYDISGEPKYEVFYTWPRVTTGPDFLRKFEAYWPWLGNDYEWVENETGVWIVYPLAWADTGIEVNPPGNGWSSAIGGAIPVRPFVHLYLNGSGGYLEIGLLIDLRASVPAGGGRYSYPRVLRWVVRYPIKEWAWRNLLHPDDIGAVDVFDERERKIVFAYTLRAISTNYEKAEKLANESFSAWCQAIHVVSPSIPCEAVKVRDGEELPRVDILNITIGSPFVLGYGMVAGVARGTNVISEPLASTLIHELGHVLGLADFYYGWTWEGDMVNKKNNERYGRSFAFRVGADSIMLVNTFSPGWVRETVIGVTPSDVFTVLYELYEVSGNRSLVSYFFPDWVGVRGSVVGACLPVFDMPYADYEVLLDTFFGGPLVVADDDLGVFNGSLAGYRLLAYMGEYGMEHGLCGEFPKDKSGFLKTWYPPKWEPGYPGSFLLYWDHRPLIDIPITRERISRRAIIVPVNESSNYPFLWQAEEP